MGTDIQYTHVPNFGYLSWFWKCKEHPCPLSPDLGLWRMLEVPDWGLASWYWFGYSHEPCLDLPWSFDHTQISDGSDTVSLESVQLRIIKTGMVWSVGSGRVLSRKQWSLSSSWADQFLVGFPYSRIKWNHCEYERFKRIILSKETTVDN